MMRMKHYHLGCGESLQSSQSGLRMAVKQARVALIRSPVSGGRKFKPGKRH